jgi:hypothetical protein
MYNVTLSKVRGGERIRTDVTEGFAYSRPCVGGSFHMFADPKDPDADIRTIWTSIVQSIEPVDEHTVEITTLNSVYRVELHPIEQGQSEEAGGDALSA